jgi:hypothetical protein
VQALSDANLTRERWDAGWQIARFEPSGQVLAAKGEQTRLLWPGEYIAQDGMGMAPRPGTSISIFTPKESRTLQPGFYFVFGEADYDPHNMRGLMRFYWNVSADGAAELVRGVTRALNRFRVPFRFKCVSSPAYYARLDSAVLFVRRRFYRPVAELLADLYPRVRPFLGEDCPLFTRPLAPGWALAEDPADGQSFGMSRCLMLAQGIWDAYARYGSQSLEARWQAVSEQFGRQGVDLARPYLNRGSVDRYEPVHVPGSL